ncbi:MAG: hypothetical protein K6E60_04675 [Saccharofermentans sp.]|nr:hypothetical protein [Saccharofermentans sp.]
MKTIQKILLGALLIGIGCLASTKVVKADPGVTLTYTPGETPTLSYATSDVLGSEGYQLELSVGGTQVGNLITLDDEHLSGTAWSGESTIITNLGNPTSSGSVTVTATIKNVVPTEPTGTASIPVYVFNPTVDNTERIEITSPTSLPQRSLSQTTQYELKVNAKSAPYYIVDVGTIATGVNATTYTKSDCTANNGSFTITSESETATISLTPNTTPITSSPITVSITWTPNVWTGYKKLTLTDTTGEGVTHTLTMPELAPPYNTNTITFTGSGSGTLTAACGPNASSLANVGTQNFTFTEAINHVTVTSGDSSVVKGGSSTYKAEVYLSPDDTRKAGVQDVTWSVLNEDGTATTYASITSAGVLTANASGHTVKVRATSTVDTNKYGDKLVTLTQAETVENITLPNNGEVTRKGTMDLSLAKLTLTPTSAASSVKSITYSIADDNYGSFNGTTFTAKTKTGSVSITATIKYVDTEKADTNITKTVTVLPKVVITDDYSSSSKTIKFTLPETVYTENSDKYNLPNVTKYQVEVLNEDGDKVLNSKTYTTSSPTSEKTLSTSDLESLIRDASSNLSGDSPKVKIRISPGGDSQTTGNTVYNTKDIVAATTDAFTVYKVGSYYSLSKDGSNSSSSSKGSSTQASASGAGSGNAGGKLDKVPKTGEGNARMLIIMIAMISATIAGAILLSYMPARANANKGIAGAEDVKEFFDKGDTTDSDKNDNEKV